MSKALWGKFVVLGYIYWIELKLQYSMSILVWLVEEYISGRVVAQNYE